MRHAILQILTQRANERPKPKSQIETGYQVADLCGNEKSDSEKGVY